VTDPYAPPPGPYDPRAQQPPQSPQGGYGPPISAQPGYSQPFSAPPGQPPYGAQPGFGTGGQPPAKSKKGLIIGLIVGAVVLLLILCGVGAALIVSNADDDDPSTPTSLSSNSPAPATTKAKPQNNNAVTADSSSDFGNVCQKGAILNAPDYSSPATAKAYVFANAPERLTTWSSKSLDSTASYYAKTADYASVNVVGCLAVEEGSEGTPLKCDIKASDGAKLTIDYLSLRYKLTFYAAKTGEEIGDGGTVNAPATKCPMFVSYNRTTLKAYASPDEATIDAALKKFLAA
jgi:hypothetical protein